MLRVILFLLGTALAEKSIAQEWFPVGASWYYNQIILGIGETYNHFEVTGEIVIQGKTCKVVSGSCACGIIGVGSYLYQEGDRIFAFDTEADTFRLLYDFNLVAGDTMVFKGDPSLVGDGLYLIDSVTHIQVGSQNLRVQHMTHLAYDLVWGDKIIERIGSNGCLYPQVGFCDPLTGGLRCYEDGEIGLVNFQVPAVPCDYISSTSKPDEVQSLKVYPNPTSDILYIESDRDIKQIELFNSLGIRSFQRLNIFNTQAEINIELLPPGIFFLKITTKDNNILVKPVVLQQ